MSAHSSAHTNKSYCCGFPTPVIGIPVMAILTTVRLVVAVLMEESFADMMGIWVAEVVANSFMLCSFIAVVTWRKSTVSRKLLFTMGMIAFVWNSIFFIAILSMGGTCQASDDLSRSLCKLLIVIFICSSLVKLWGVYCYLVFLIDEVNDTENPLSDTMTEMSFETV